MFRAASVAGVPVRVPTLIYAADLACWIPAILWAHVVAGGRALRRIGSGWGTAFAAFVAVYGVIFCVESQMGGSPEDIAAVPTRVGAVAGILLGIVVTAAALVALWFRSRAWTRAA